MPGLLTRCGEDEGLAELAPAVVVHGPEPDLVLRVHVEAGQHHVVATAGPGPGVAGRVWDEGEVIPGGGHQVRRHRAQALQQQQVGRKVRVVSSISLSNFNFVRLHEDYISNAQLCP